MQFQIIKIKIKEHRKSFWITPLTQQYSFNEWVDNVLSDEAQAYANTANLVIPPFLLPIQTDGRTDMTTTLLLS